MSPGRRVRPEPSIVRIAAGTLRLAPTASIIPFLTQTSPLAVTRDPSKIRALRMTNSFLDVGVWAKTPMLNSRTAKALHGVVGKWYVRRVGPAA